MKSVSMNEARWLEGSDNGLMTPAENEGGADYINFWMVVYIFDKMLLLCFFFFFEDQELVLRKLIGQIDSIFVSIIMNQNGRNILVALFIGDSILLYGDVTVILA